MKMKQFFHLTFVFLILACLAHSASAITEIEKRMNSGPTAGGNMRIVAAYHH